ncbi:CPBP family intramembrane glutamic endopeptidase [Actinomyces qiguomingii]|uniref:CPBP family intramembrane glutamic endopeptidase n=1 Tax=Actinomyces qiguomingii TaxID=2057800 RepID=UPI001304CC67|nr:CPBP family intramembrane glutamic endopeptidase [Actinomyces qiguomingii]
MTIKLLFIVAYAIVFLLPVDLPFVPEGSGLTLTMVAYPSMFILAVAGWHRELVAQVRQLVSGGLRSVGALAIGLIGANILVHLGTLISDWLAASLPNAGEQLTNDTNISSAIDAYPPWMIIGALAVVGPIVEEMFFRQFLLSAVAKHTRTWVGIVASSILFGMLHMSSFSLSEWVGIIPHTCFGIAFGILFAWMRKNVLFPSVVHVLNNLNGLVPSL